MRINNNIMAMNTFRQYSINTSNSANSTEKLSSGYRINRAGDDAAGLAISEKMRAQIRGLNMASKNSQDAISLVQTAEGALTETHSILQRMRELSTQSASDTNDSEVVDREALNEEFQALKSEINDIANKTAFNGKKLLDGSFGTTSYAVNPAGVKENNGGIEKISIEGFAAGSTYTVTFAEDTGVASLEAGSGFAGTDTIATDTSVDGQTKYTIKNAGNETLGTITLYTDSSFDPTTSLDDTTLAFTATKTASIIQTGANQGDTMEIAIDKMDADALQLDTTVKLDTQSDAADAITTVNNAINTVSTQRSKLGAYQNRLQHKINNLDTTSENLSAAESRIRDLDMAKEMTTYTRNNILVQAATAMLAQANSAPQGVLQLLQ